MDSDHRQPIDQMLDRRAAERVPCPTEVVAVWHHDMDTSLRYRVSNVSDNGMRISTRVPLVEGMTGEALRLLPEGTPMNKSMMVAWCHPCPDTPDHYDIGVRFI